MTRYGQFAIEKGQRNEPELDFRLVVRLFLIVFFILVHKINLISDLLDLEANRDIILDQCGTGESSCL